MKDLEQPGFKKPLIGLTASEIAEIVSIKEKYRGRQILEWILKGVNSFEQMLNLPLALREKLEDSCCIYSSSVEESETDTDGTLKIAVKLFDGELIESVLLTDETGRKTACISCQSGCAMGCSFCRTGRMGLKRNLSSAEIIEQFMHLKAASGPIDNIVYMGMGEPLMNTDEVIKSITYFTSEQGMGLSARRITVSTCGIVKGIRRFSTDAPPIRLAVSLVTADPQKRMEIMPVTKTNSLTELKEVLLDYQKAGGRRITLECAIIKGINDTAADASAVADWAEGLRVNVNVIPWNPASEIDYEEPEMKQLEAFCRELERRKLPFSRRYRRGSGLNAACGQLAVNLEKKAD